MMMPRGYDIFLSGLLKWQKRQNSASLDSLGEHPLVTCAGAGDPAGQNFSLLRNEPAQSLDVLIIDNGDLFHAEHTNLPLGEAPGVSTGTLGTLLSIRSLILGHNTPLLLII